MVAAKRVKTKRWCCNISRTLDRNLLALNNKVLLYSTENYTQNPVINRNGKDIRKNMCVYICAYNWITLLYSRNWHNTVLKTIKFFFFQSLNCIRLFETPWTIIHQGDFPGSNTAVGCHFLLQGIFLTPGSNLCLLHWQVDSLPLSHQGSPYINCISIENKNKNPVEGKKVVDTEIREQNWWFGL